MNPTILALGGATLILTGWEADSPSTLAIGFALVTLAAAIKWA